MFKDVYKQALDDIEPRENLLADILEKGTQKKPKRNFKAVGRWASTAAAVFVFAAVAVAYPNMVNKYNEQKRADYEFAAKEENSGESVNDTAEESLETQSTAEEKSAEDFKDKVVTETVTEDKAGYGEETAETVENKISSESNEKAADTQPMTAFEDTQESVNEESAGIPMLTSLDASDYVDSADEEQEEEVGSYSSARASTGGGGSSSGAGAVQITEDSALKIAKTAVTAEYESTQCSYDSEKNMWCVTFISKGETVCTVYVTEDGSITEISEGGM